LAAVRVAEKYSRQAARYNGREIEQNERAPSAAAPPQISPPAPGVLFHVAPVPSPRLLLLLLLLLSALARN